jgi:diacylglycerol kinase family enzyme
LPCYARGLPIVPQAIGTDGLLDICAYNGGSLYAGLKLLFHTLLRRHHRLPNCQMLRATQLRLESDRPIPYQIDGDPGGWLPVNIEIIPQRMRLVVPKQFHSS